MFTFHLAFLKSTLSALSKSSNWSNSFLASIMVLAKSLSWSALKKHWRLLASRTKSFQTYPLLHRVLSLPKIQRQCLKSSEVQYLFPPNLLFRVKKLINSSKTCIPSPCKSHIDSLWVWNKMKWLMTVGSYSGHYNYVLFPTLEPVNCLYLQFKAIKVVILRSKLLLNCHYLSSIGRYYTNTEFLFWIYPFCIQRESQRRMLNSI